jgi:hypothetical protein
MSHHDDRPLPTPIRRALDAVVDGPGRTPTTAHPDCVCGKPVPLEQTPLTRGLGATSRVGTKADCPQHRPEK